MAENGKYNGPPCPKVGRLEELIDLLTAQKSARRADDGQLSQSELETITQRDAVLQETIEALDWLHTSLSNRATYHKKQQVRRKFLMRAAEQLLGPDEMKQVDALVDKELSNE